MDNGRDMGLKLKLEVPNSPKNGGSSTRPFLDYPAAESMLSGFPRHRGYTPCDRSQMAAEQRKPGLF